MARRIAGHTRGQTGGTRPLSGGGRNRGAPRAPYWEAQAKIDAAALLSREPTASETAFNSENEALKIAEDQGYHRLTKRVAEIS